MKRIFTLICLTAGLAAAADAADRIAIDFNKGLGGCTVLDFSEAAADKLYYKTDKATFANSWSLMSVTPEELTLKENAVISDIARDGIKAAVTISRLEGGESPATMLRLPALDVAEGAWLKWTAKSIHDFARNSYTVMVTTGDPDDIETYTELATIEKEDYFFATHMLSLVEYAGKTVTIGFLNNDAEGYMLAIKDVYAGIPEWGYGAKNVGDHFFGRNEQAAVTLAVTNYGGKAIKAFNVLPTDGREQVLGSIEGIEIPIGETAEVYIPVDASVGYPERYEVGAQFEDDTNQLLLNDFINVSEFKRRPLVEKFTATWCNNCPRLGWVTHYYTHLFGDEAIYLEPHVSNGAGTDWNGCNEYVMPIAYCVGGDYPSLMINREFRQNSTKAFDHTPFLKASMAPCTVGINLEVLEFEAGAVKARATVTSSEDIDNADGYYRIGFTLAEHHAAVADDEYQQRNTVNFDDAFYSNEAHYIPKVYPRDITKFQNVVRGPADGGTGIVGSLPATIKAGEVYEYIWTSLIPESVKDPMDLMLVATMVRYIENKGSSPALVLNADAKELDTKTGIGSVTGTASHLSATAEGEAIRVSFAKAGNYSVSAYDTLGQLLSTASGNGSEALLPCPDGVVIIRAVLDGTAETLKITK